MDISTQSTSTNHRHLDENHFRQRVLTLLESYEGLHIEEVCVGINREFYEIENFTPYENMLRDKYGTGGACLAQWGSHSIAFRCSDCEKDQSSVLCADCFFKSNHEGHAFRMIRSVGGCCDCGDSSSWDPKGYCSDHEGVSKAMDGPMAYEQLPEMLRLRASSIIKIVIEMIETEIEECYPCWITTTSGSDDKTNAITRAKTRVLPLLKWAQHIATITFGFRYVVNQSLKDDFIKTVIRKHFDFPRVVEKWFQNFFLSLLVSPSFKKRFAELLVRDYIHALSGCYDMMLADSPTSQDESFFYSLTVQLFTVPELAMACILEWNLLPTLCHSLKSRLPISNDTNTVTFQQYEPRTQFDVSRILIDLKYLLHHGRVIDYFLDEQSGQNSTIVSSSNSFDSLIELLAALQNMNLQKRFTDVHISYEDSSFEEAFRVEFDISKALSVMVQHCKQPLALNRIIGFYSKLAGAVRELPSRPVGWYDTFSFHIPLLRFFTSIVDKHLIFRLMESKTVSPEEQQLLDVFDYDVAMKLLESGLSCLIFASEIDHGYWIRNGRVMQQQRNTYVSSLLGPVDLEMVQFAVKIIAYLGSRDQSKVKNLLHVETRSIPLDVDDITSSEQLHQYLWKFDSFCIIFSEVFKLTNEHQTICSIKDIWNLTEQTILAEGQVKRDGGTRQISNTFRVNFIYELLGRLINQLYFMESVSIPRKVLHSAYVQRGTCIIRREIIQRLAVQSMSFSHLEQLMKPWRRHPNFEQIVGDVADKRTVGTTASQTTTLLRLRPDSWRYVDIFWPVMKQKDMQQAEEEALTHKNAELLGPTRADARMSPHFEFLKDSLVDAFSRSILSQVILECIHVKARAFHGKINGLTAYESQLIPTSWSPNMTEPAVPSFRLEVMLMENESAMAATEQSDQNDPGLSGTFEVEMTPNGPNFNQEELTGIIEQALSQYFRRQSTSRVAGVSPTSNAEMQSPDTSLLNIVSRPPLVTLSSSVPPSTASNMDDAQMDDTEHFSQSRHLVNSSPSLLMEYRVEGSPMTSEIRAIEASVNSEDPVSAQASALALSAGTLVRMISASPAGRGSAGNRTPGNRLPGNRTPITDTTSEMSNSLSSTIEESENSSQGSSIRGQPHFSCPSQEPSEETVEDTSGEVPTSRRMLLQFRISVNDSTRVPMTLSPSGKLHEKLGQTNPDFLLPHFLKILDVLHQAQRPVYPHEQMIVEKTEEQSTAKRQKSHVNIQSEQPGDIVLELRADRKRLESTLIHLRSLCDLSSIPAACIRCITVLLGRLQDIYRCTVIVREGSLDASPDDPFSKYLVVELSDSPVTTTLPVGSPGSGEAKELEEAKRRQAEVLAALQQEQSAFLEMMESELESEDEEATNTNSENESGRNERLLDCVMCREKGSRANPLGQIVYVTYSNVLRRASLGGKSAFPNYGPVLTSCGHVGHISCLNRHRKAVRTRKNVGEFFFADISGGQFPCPVCRSLGNEILPYIPIGWIVNHNETEELALKLKWNPQLYETSNIQGPISTNIWDFEEAVEELENFKTLNVSTTQSDKPVSEVFESEENNSPSPSLSFFRLDPVTAQLDPIDSSFAKARQYLREAPLFRDLYPSLFRNLQQNQDEEVEFVEVGQYDPLEELQADVTGEPGHITDDDHSPALRFDVLHDRLPVAEDEANGAQATDSQALDLDLQQEERQNTIQPSTEPASGSDGSNEQVESPSGNSTSSSTTPAGTAIRSFVSSVRSIYIRTFRAFQRQRNNVVEERSESMPGVSRFSRLVRPGESSDEVQASDCSCNPTDNGTSLVIRCLLKLQARSEPRWNDANKRLLLSSTEMFDLSHPPAQRSENNEDESDETEISKKTMNESLSNLEVSRDVSTNSVELIVDDRKTVLIDPLDGSVIARRNVPSDSWCFTLAHYFSSVPLMLKHSAGLRGGGHLNWIIYTELLLSSSMRESRITTIDQAPIPPHVLAIRNALLLRNDSSHRPFSAPLSLSYWFGARESFSGFTELHDRTTVPEIFAAFVVNPWSCDIRQEFLWGFTSGEICSKTLVQQWTLELMAIRSIQILEESVLDLLMSEELSTLVQVDNERQGNTDQEHPQKPQTAFNDISTPPPEVLEELLNVWLKDANAVPLGDLEAGVKWSRRLQQDTQLRDRMCRGHQNIRKRGRKDISKDQQTLNGIGHGLNNTVMMSTEDKEEHQVNKVRNLNDPRPRLPGLLDGRMEENKKLEYYLMEIENRVLQIAAARSKAASSIQSPTSHQSSSCLNMQRTNSTTLLSDPLSLSSLSPCALRRTSAASNTANGVTTKTSSAVEDASRPQFCGPDKLHRFESQILSMVSLTATTTAKTTKGKSVPQGMDVRAFSSKVLWTYLLDLFPHCPRLIDIISKEEILESFTDSIFTHQLFVAVHIACLNKRFSNAIPSELLKSIIRRRWDQFQETLIESLRRFLVFVCWTISSIWQLSESDRNRIAYPGKDLKAHYRSLCTILGISSRFDSSSPSLIKKALELMWNPAFIKHIKVCRASHVETRAPSFDSLESLKLIQLPKPYLEVIKSSYKRACPSCGQQPTDPALCLLCGAIMCVDGQCCKPVLGEGECTRHARRCGGGQGLLILTHLSLILAIDAPRCCFFDSPYVDRHGETNILRGKPLHLSERRLEELRQMLFFAETGR